MEMLLSLILLLNVLEKRLYTYQKTKYQLDVNELNIFNCNIHKINDKDSNLIS